MDIKRSFPRVMSQEDRSVLINLVRDGGESLLPGTISMPSNQGLCKTPSGQDLTGIRKRFLDGVSVSRQLGLSRNELNGHLAPKPAFILLPSPTAKRLTLLFSGTTADYFLPPALLTEHDTHLVVMRDASRCFHLAGIPGLGRDYAECLKNLRRVIDHFKVGQTFCVGVSSGGGGALRFGCDLHADGILGFSVPTTLNIDDDPGAEIRKYPQLNKLYKIDRSLGVDLKTYYEATVPRPAVILAYSSGHPRDKWLAERMQSVAGVELVEADPLIGHRTYGWFRDTDRLNSLFDKFFGLTPVTVSKRF